MFRLKHPGTCRAVSFSPDGKRFLSAGNGLVIVWDSGSGGELLRISDERKMTLVAAFSADGKFIAGGGMGVENLWDSYTGKEYYGDTAVLRFSSLAFSPDGKYTLMGFSNNIFAIRAKAWDADTAAFVKNAMDSMQAEGKRKIIGRHLGHSGSVLSVSFSPDSSRMMTAGGDMTAIIWDTETCRALRTIRGHEGTVNSAVFSPDGQNVLTASDDRTLRLQGIEQDIGIMKLAGNSSFILDMCFSRDDHFFVTAGTDTVLRIWRTEDGVLIRTIEGNMSQIESVCFSPDDRYVASGTASGEAFVFDAETGGKKITINTIGRIQSLRFSPDGKRIAIVNSSTMVTVWNTLTGDRELCLEPDERYLGGRGGLVAFSPDGKMLATAGVGKMIAIYDAYTGKKLGDMGSSRNCLNGIEFSPDGRRILSSGLDGYLRLWDIAHGQELISMKVHFRGVFTGSFFDDGRRGFSWTSDGTAKIWDLATGREMATLALPGTGFDPAGAVCPSTGRIATSTSDHAVILWDILKWKGQEMNRHQDDLQTFWAFDSSLRPLVLRVAAKGGKKPAELEFAIRNPFPDKLQGSICWKMNGEGFPWELPAGLTAIDIAPGQVQRISIPSPVPAILELSQAFSLTPVAVWTVRAGDKLVWPGVVAPVFVDLPEGEKDPATVLLNALNFCRLNKDNISAAADWQRLLDILLKWWDTDKFQDGNPTAILALISKMKEFLPEQTKDRAWYYLKLIRLSEQKKDKSIEDIWKQFLSDNIAMDSIPQADMHQFLDGEKWAHSGRPGNPPKPLYVIAHKSEAAITFDGKLDEPIYSELVPLPGPYCLNNGEDVEKPVQAGSLALKSYLFYTDKFLHVGVKVPEPCMDALRCKLPAGENSGAWADDGIELFFDMTRNLSEYLHWHVSNGEAFSYVKSKISGYKISKDLIIQMSHGKVLDEFACATYKGNDYYTMEFRIPLSQFTDSSDAKALSGRLVNANLRRNRYLSAKMTEGTSFHGERLEISWGQESGFWHNPHRFNFMVFE
ncbi:MAG TPA: hypothetical protein DCZ94_13710 [Lentisphaeria bacterium]|nr:MAG: hypothetical protein A2X48_11285 [Lentisphaerae bacterium GWF2_49_21]HBC88002.1 hypothetical protein [Lentisphaeria bacterium]